MVIDSSALIAVLRDEPEGDRFRHAMRGAYPRLVAAPTAVEASILMLSRFGEEGLAGLQAFMVATEITVVPLAAEHVAYAVDAFRRFGKGRHPAVLNYGDCFSYALAQATAEPLLFKGNDFRQTDVRRAL